MQRASSANRTWRDSSSACECTATVEIRVEGAGSVSGPGFDCRRDCSAALPARSDAVVRARPEPGFRFAGWSGACSGAGNCEFVASDTKRLVATFVETPAAERRDPAREFDVRVRKTGRGRVVEARTGIECGRTCRARAGAGSRLVFQAVARRGSRFVGWGGACEGSNARCELALDADVTVIGRFSRVR